MERSGAGPGGRHDSAACGQVNMSVKSALTVTMGGDYGAAVTPERRLVGREAELAALLASMRDAFSGHGRLLLIVGEPGIGKTRLASELAERAEAERALVRWGRCHEGEGAPAFSPWRQILRAQPGERRAGKPRRSRRAPAHDRPRRALEHDLTGIVERLDDATTSPHLAPDQARFELFERASLALRGAAEKRPLVLILDDLHWADRSSLHLLQFLAREVATSRILILATFRDPDASLPAEASALLQELAVLGRTTHLRGLARPEIAELVAERAGFVPDERLVQTIEEATQGNPFFIDELARLLAAEQQVAPRDAPGRPAALRIPLGVREAIHRRLAGLEDETRHVLRIASVIGREFDLGLLEHALERPPDGFLAALDGAQRLGIIAPHAEAPRRFVFSHALVRETLYEDLPLGEQAAWHRRIGEALEAQHGADLEPHLAALAQHFFLAARDGDAAKAVEYGFLAGDRARRQLAFEEAASMLGRALAALDLIDGGGSTARRAEILLALAEARRGLGQVDEMIESFRQAIEIARHLDAETFARAVVHFSAVRGESYFVDEPLVRLIEEALAMLPQGDGELRARLLARLAATIHLLPGAEARRAALVEESTAMARRLRDKHTLAWVLFMRLIATLGPDGIEERLTLTGEIMRIADELGDPVPALEAQTWRIHELLELGDVEAVDLGIQSFERRASHLKQPVHLWHLATWRVTRALLEGRLVEAEALLGEALAAGQRAQQQSAFMRYGEQLLMLRWEQGRMAELEGMVRMGVDQAPTVPTWRIVIASLHLQLGRREEAQLEIDRIAEHGFVDLPRDANWLFAVVSLAHVVHQLGDLRRADLVYALLRPYAGRITATRPAVTCSGGVSHYLGILARTCGRLTQAIGHLEQALTEHGRLRSTPWVVRSQTELALALLDREQEGDARRALELARAAVATASELGMQGALAEATVALDRAQSDVARLDELQTARAEAVGERPDHSEPRAAGGRTAVVGAASGGAVALATRRRGASIVRLAAVERGPRPAAEGVDPMPAANLFQREGDFWTIRFQGSVVRQKHSVGLAYIAHLLRHPGHEFTVWDLNEFRSGRPRDARDSRPGGNRGTELGRVALGLGDAGEVLDSQARAGYRRRLAELREDLEEARAHDDLGRIDRAETEIGFIESELTRATGLGSRSRRAVSDAERARLRITKAIRYATDRAAAHHPALADHLRVSIRTGRLCSYSPSPGAAVAAWRF